MTLPQSPNRQIFSLIPIVVLIVLILILGSGILIQLNRQPQLSNAPKAVTTNNQWTPQTRSFNGVDMVLVPPGCFMIGSSGIQAPEFFIYNSVNEKPQIKVCYIQPFWIDKTLVSQEQFKQFNGAAVYRSYFTGDMLPVVQITWFEASNYCTHNRGGWLPTEAEWEYVARGPDDLIYPWGNSFDPNKTVYWLNTDHKPAAVNRTDRIAPSWVGATDMAGNVWQWTSSLSKPYPYDPNDGRESQTGTTDQRTLRGGSWQDDADGMRSAVRISIAPGEQFSNVGFRCARSF